MSVTGQETSEAKRYLLYAIALLAAALIQDEAGRRRQLAYLKGGWGKSELFRETMAWDWLKRCGYLK